MGVINVYETTDTKDQIRKVQKGVDLSLRVGKYLLESVEQVMSVISELHELNKIAFARMEADLTKINDGIEMLLEGGAGSGISPEDMVLLNEDRAMVDAASARITAIEAMLRAKTGAARTIV